MHLRSHSEIDATGREDGVCVCKRRQRRKDNKGIAYHSIHSFAWLSSSFGGAWYKKRNKEKEKKAQGDKSCGSGIERTRQRIQGNISFTRVCVSMAQVPRPTSPFFTLKTEWSRWLLAFLAGTTLEIKGN